MATKKNTSQAPEVKEISIAVNKDNPKVKAAIDVEKKKAKTLAEYAKQNSADEKNIKKKDAEIKNRVDENQKKMAEAKQKSKKEADKKHSENVKKQLVSIKKQNEVTKKNIAIAKKKTATTSSQQTEVKEKSAPIKKVATATVNQQTGVKEKSAPVKKVTDTKKADGKTMTKAGKSDKIKILLAGSEVMPFVGTGGLGEVIGSLPKSIQGADGKYDIRVIIPYYGDIKDEFKNAMTHLGHTFVDLGWRHQYAGVSLIEKEGVKYYFIDNEYYFSRVGLYGFYDDLERFAFFSKAVLDILPVIDFYPDIIHCNDWQTALIPVYYKAMYQDKYNNIKTIFTIHNIEYQGKYDMYLLGDILGLDNNCIPILKYEDCMNLMKGAIQVADLVSTVSKNYASEILSEYYSHGLHHILRENSSKLVGILNGINVESYYPKTDKSVFFNYDIDSIDKKGENKKQLQQMLGLPVDEGIPIIAVISRLAAHKGMDLISHIIEEVLKDRVQFVLLGTGEAQYEKFFSYLDANYTGKVRSIIGFNSDMARKIYAGADLFLMPSKSEPCGLSQMIASRYGTIPIVRETGGLYDSIKDFGVGADGNGFTFQNYNAHDMMYTIKRALRDYEDKEKWQKHIKRVMSVDFSWEKSAKEYISVYNDLLK